MLAMVLDILCSLPPRLVVGEFPTSDPLMIVAEIWTLCGATKYPPVPVLRYTDCSVLRSQSKASLNVTESNRSWISFSKGLGYRKGGAYK